MLLAKSAYPGRLPVTLLQHTRDVTECVTHLFGQAERPTRLGRQWLRFFGLQDARAFLDCTAAAAVFHDWGKAEQSWQESLGGGPPATVRHEHLSGLVLDLDGVAAWLGGRPEINWDVVLAAVLCHHLKVTAETFAARPAHRSWLRLLSDDAEFDALRDYAAGQLCLPGTAPAVPRFWSFDPSPDQVDLEAHAGRVRRRLKRFERAVREDEVRQRLLWAVRAGLIAADAAGSGLVRVGHRLQEWLAETFDERSVCTRGYVEQEVIARRVAELTRQHRWHDWSQFQRDCDRLPDRALLLAPCGSGKTLAAWRWIAARLAERPAAHVLFLYPTRATATEGFRDYVSWAPEADAALLHGTAAFDLEGLFTAPAEPGDPRGAKHFEAEQRLFALGFWRKRVFSATVDQFLAFLQYGYGPVCLLPVLADAVVVLDEVHSFDRGMFSALKEFLTHFRVPVLCMTATLPEDRRRQLRDCGLIEYGEKPGDLQAIASAPRYQVRRTTRAEAADQVRAALVDGRRVLWVVNTVRRAQELTRGLADNFPAGRLRTAGGVPVLCYHSRFRLVDRRDRHQEVVHAFQGQGEAALAVTTQVCEMSLDLDADLLVMEDCPVTSLVQRMGRCNRRRQPRAGAGRVLIYPPEDARPYDEEALTGVGDFIEKLSRHDWVTQADLERALAEVPLPPGRADKACRFLESGAYARSTEETFRDIEEFAVPAVLGADLGEYLELRRRNRPADGLVVPVPRKLAGVHPDLPPYLGLADDRYYDAATGFWDGPVANGQGGRS
jgi:CRISPR-associated endonuclease/helicase Cas3